MTKFFMLLIQLSNDSVEIAKHADASIIIAFEENIHVLNELGDRLLEENIIIGYQIVTPIGLPVRKI